MKIAFQGTYGSYSHLAAKNLFPQAQFLPFLLFDEALKAVEEGQAQAAVIPIENSSMGRVADIHSLLPHTSLVIEQEYFLPIHHCLLAVKGAKQEDIKEVHSQIPALAQCEKTLKKMNITPVPAADTATMAKKLAAEGNLKKAALASSLAAEIYGLEILKQNMQDYSHNTTRFIVLKPHNKASAPAQNVPCITTLLFRVKNAPAALTHALQVFANQNINLLKLESYMDENFQSTAFYVDAECHSQSLAFKTGLENLKKYTEEIRLLGSYPQASFRNSPKN